MKSGWISLTTDYGLSDGFVGVLRGVIARVAPDVRVIDITHDVHPGDVARGAAVIAQAVPYLPVAVHVAVVDPGVGSARRGIALETPSGVLVGPDNGLLVAGAEALGGIVGAVQLTNEAWHLPHVSATFHGRDVFAPVAARLALGEPFAEAGDAIDPRSLVRLPPPLVSVGHGYVEAEVLTVDRFGNVQLAAPASALAELTERVSIGGMRAWRRRTFAEAGRGELIVFGDSAGYAAIAINGGRAVVALSVEAGELVRIVNG